MSKFSDLDKFLQNNLATGPSGCGCAVAQDGEVLYENYFGYADIDKKTPITADSVYRQFSTTKVSVCTGAMLLFEQGKFLLNDPIYEYFPEWKNTMVAEDNPDGTVTIRPAKRPIQVRDCFTMSMGIGYGGPDYTHRTMNSVRDALAANVGDYTLRQDIKAMADVPIRFDPGEHWLYGFGHELVAGLIEVTSGMSVAEFLKKELFEPLEMTHTGYHFFDNMRDNLVTAYQRDENGELVKIDKPMFEDRLEPDAKYEAGGAGLFSSVMDYINLTQMLACGGEFKGRQIMGRKTIDLMRANHLTPQQIQDFRFDYVDGYGYGLGVRTYMEEGSVSNTSVGEFGWTGAMGTYIAVDPSERASVVYMHNLSPNQEMYTHHRVRNIAFGALK